MVLEEITPNSVDSKDDKSEDVKVGWVDEGVDENDEDATAQIPRSHIEKEPSGERRAPRKNRGKTREGRRRRISREMFDLWICSRCRRTEENGVP